LDRGVPRRLLSHSSNAVRRLYAVQCRAFCMPKDFFVFGKVWRVRRIAGRKGEFQGTRDLFLSKCARRRNPLLGCLPWSTSNADDTTSFAVGGALLRIQEFRIHQIALSYGPRIMTCDANRGDHEICGEKVSVGQNQGTTARLAWFRTIPETQVRGFSHNSWHGS
jgi:hypothetical protein